jgi:formylglycine-generating enzyme required for sulfatase activity
MRCLNCRRDGIALDTQVCPQCGVYLPSLMRDLLPPGTLLDGGKYRIDYALGQGGFGITYRAADLNLDRLVAIKEFYPQAYVHREDSTGRLTVPIAEANAYQRWLQRFEREGRILARLNHPGIVKVFSLFKERETAYIVMELLTGKTLGDELDAQDDKKLSPERLEAVMAALVSALDTVHHEGVYHLDLKPDNVMVTQEGRIVLVDFGAARQDLQGSEANPSKKSTSAFTMEYAPPELIGGQPVSAASDLFELGMILHELLTGQRPEAAWNRLLRDAWTPATLAEPWAEMLTAALRLRPEERPQSVAQWWQTRGGAQPQQRQQPVTQTYIQPIPSQPPSQSETAADPPQETAAHLRQQTAAIAQPTTNQLPAGQISNQQVASQQVANLQAPQQPQRQNTQTYVQHTPATNNLQPQPERPAPIAPTSAKSPQQVNRRGFNRRWLLLGGLGATGLGGAWLLSLLLERQPKQPPALQSDSTPATPPTNSPSLPTQAFKFEVVTINEVGTVIKREQTQANRFIETLAKGITLEMVAIPAGEFLMGSPENEQFRDKTESPQHRVTVPAFYIGQHVITQAQWRAVMGNNPAKFQGETHPVQMISWNDAQAFCQKLSQQTGRTYRLPSTAEWEYACRAGTTTPFHFGPTITTYLANYQGNYAYGAGPKGQQRQTPLPVGSFPANGFGLREMHGNVWEWCEDIAHPNYQGAPTDGSAWVTDGDPDVRVLRGGSWNISPGLCRSAYTNFTAKVTFRSVDHGLRVVLEAV